MHIEPVEIYSDSTNAAILRHPSRRYPGCLIQGDTLYSLMRTLEDVQASGSSLTEDAADGLADVIEHLRKLIEHYKTVLNNHNIELPFYEPPSV